MDFSEQCGTILLVCFMRKGDIRVQYIIEFSFMDYVPNILVYQVLSLLSLGAMYFFKKKSDRDMKKLEEENCLKSKLTRCLQVQLC